MYRIAYWPLLFLLTLLSLLPLKVHYGLSNILYVILYSIFRYRRSVVAINLARSFPELKYNELHQLSKDYYHHMCDIMVETIWAYTASSKRTLKLISYPNTDFLGDIYGEGRNVIVVVGHQGCWELTNAIPNLRETFGLNIDNQDIYFVYKKMKSKAANRLIVRMRGCHDSGTLIETDHIPRQILKNKNGKGVYFFIADQNPAHLGAKFAVNFLNQTTAMVNGPEYMARKMGMPVLFAGIGKINRGNYSLTFQLICEDASKCEEGYVTKEYARLLEESIRANKSSWLWSHKRWKRNIELDENIKFL